VSTTPTTGACTPMLAAIFSREAVKVATTKIFRPSIKTRCFPYLDFKCISYKNCICNSIISVVINLLIYRLYSSNND
jgi:hypothetical protein